MIKLKKYKKQIFIILGVFILLFIPTFLFINLTNPTKINKYIASVSGKSIPSNSAFDDQNFYNCVVDAYNKQNNASVAYTESLTDEQLKTITSLSCSGYDKSEEEKISSADGLEKLTSLKNLYLQFNKLDTIDVSENTALTYLRLSDNNLTEIDVSNNTALIDLDLDSNELTTIAVSKNTALKSLRVYNNNLTTIDVSKNKALKVLVLNSNNIATIDVSNNTALTYLALSYNKLTEIDVSKNTSLERLTLSNNNLTTIDVSNNTALIVLYLASNELTTIDVSNNILLEDLYLYDNELEIKDMFVRKNTIINENSSIKLPKDSKKFYVTYETEDNKVAKYEDGKICALEVGKTNIVATLNGVKSSLSSTSSDMKISGEITVYDITSNKYKVTNNYIYTNSDIDDDTILSNIIIKGVEKPRKGIYNNKLQLEVEKKLVEELPIVNVSSSTYDLSKGYIYIGAKDFDKTKVTCTNCVLEVVDSKLIIKFGSEVIKTYNLVTGIKGDINSDGDVTVLDVALLYRHVRRKKVITDQEILLLSDINNDGQITIIDVSLMYRYAKGKTNKL